MPCLKLHTSAPVPEAQREPLLQELSAIVSEVIGKPTQYVMVALSEGPMCMSGQVGPAAFVDVRSIGGLSGGVNKQLSERICSLLGDKLDIAGNRVFLNFAEVPASSWGWDGGTFG